MGKKLWTTAALMVVGALLVSACSSQATPTAAPATATPAAATPAPGATATPVPAAAVPAVPTGYTELDKALGADQPYKGKSVTMQTQWVGGEGLGFAAAIADFGKATGITFKIDSIASSHETILRTRIEGGSPPDLAVLAQPTAVVAYADEGKVIDLASFMDAKKLTDEHAATIGPLTKDGHIWGLPYKADSKSVIWYPVKAFAAKGYTVPTTWDELIALSDKIVADGSHPWCASAGGPGTATGWQVTDFIEEVVLKTKGIDYYNNWITHAVTFQDPGIKDALDKYVGKIYFTPNYVDGGGQAIANKDQKTPMDPMFEQDTAAPGCWMQKIPTWYGPDFFPDQRTSGQPSKYKIGADGDIGIFPFPTIDPNFNGAEGSGDTVLVLVDRPEVRAFAEFLATPEGIENWIRSPGAISTNNKTPADWYAGNYKLTVGAEVLSKAAYVGFDASDLMPPSVGQGTFWTQMVDWLNNNGSNTDAVLKAIDDSWPST
jgi:alpha-glucoside transport system substrate-binding protein